MGWMQGVSNMSERSYSKRSAAALANAIVDGYRCARIHDIAFHSPRERERERERERATRARTRHAVRDAFGGDTSRCAQMLEREGFR
ncbi:hypothetical protein [Burkholderia gladioli]|uniref:hypothetical protein n=1 Tax=Burkholderia gladioli TaxID=28095 RepID=UPI00163E0660|nr:hypothetical protein [Burkholderia gladioli]